MKFRTLFGLKLAQTLAFVFTLAASNAGAQCPTNVNLITNGDAEAQRSLTGNTNHDVSSWEGETGAFTVVRYDQGGGFPTAASPGPGSRGNYFFSGGPTSANASASQTVDISGCAALVDTGVLPFSFSGYFGGFTGQADRAQLTVQFFTGSGILTALTTIGPVTSADRGNTTGLLARSINGSIPIGARSVVFTLSMTQQSGDNDGYADNLNFTILGPTAADVTAGGRVTDRYGRGISQVSVSITDFNGISRRVFTNTFGYFSFTGVEAGQTYVLSATHRRYSFSSAVVNLSDSVSDLSIVAN